MLNRLRAPLGALLVLVAAPVAAQEITPAEHAAIDTAVRSALDKSGVPSAQIAIVRGGKPVLAQAWGTAAPGMPAAPGQPYQIASNSKQFLAALMLLLENDGKLSLDDHVNKWIRGVTGGERITIRQLLSHTSGLQDFWPQDYSFKAMEQPVSPEAIVSRWAARPLDYEPGTRWQYSNTGYVVAGLIAERAGGKPLWTQFEERLFRPLGIHPLKLDDTNGPGFPKGYHRFALGPVRVAQPAARGWLWAAGELSMTAADLAKWDMARIERKVLPASDWETMETPVRLADGSSGGYGLGVYNRVVDGRRVIDHGGESVGFLSQNSTWIDDKAAIVVLTNADFGGVTGELTTKIAQIVLPRASATVSGETDRVADARSALAALAAGRWNPARFTDNAQYYFTPQVRGDYRTSLAALGPLKTITARPPRLRGGFVNRNYILEYAKRKLVLVTYAEPGAAGRWEQFIVMPE
ncbi:serine hydrolase domain-containing protein [Parablastomonas sp. CN1-191]|uniref:serine hydrolase domain-containing protein n=1 Tax=Parablastomonas sp. CN1-191 TaxID=3400908 RepID=UPI003BF82772